VKHPRLLCALCSSFACGYHLLCLPPLFPYWLSNLLDWEGTKFIRVDLKQEQLDCERRPHDPLYTLPLKLLCVDFLVRILVSQKGVSLRLQLDSC
jgi:hypothetical protein